MVAAVRVCSAGDAGGSVGGGSSSSSNVISNNTTLINPNTSANLHSPNSSNGTNGTGNSGGSNSNNQNNSHHHHHQNNHVGGKLKRERAFSKMPSVEMATSSENNTVNACKYIFYFKFDLFSNKMIHLNTSAG